MLHVFHVQGDLEARSLVWLASEPQHFPVSTFPVLNYKHSLPCLTFPHRFWGSDLLCIKGVSSSAPGSNKWPDLSNFQTLSIQKAFAIISYSSIVLLGWNSEKEALYVSKTAECTASCFPGTEQRKTDRLTSNLLLAEYPSPAYLPWWIGRCLRWIPWLPSTKAFGGLWYTEAKEPMWQMSSSRRVGSMRSVSSEINGFSDNTTSLAVTGSVERRRQ